MYSVLILLSGVLQAVMQSLNGLLSGVWGLFGVSLIVHVSGGLLLLAYMLLFLKKKISFAGLPWYLYSSGLCGVLLVSLTSLCVRELGVSVTTCISVAGQLVLSAVVDHCGWFGVPRVRFALRRVPAFCMVLAGLVLLNLS